VASCRIKFAPWPNASEVSRLCLKFSVCPRVAKQSSESLSLFLNDLNEISLFFSDEALPSKCSRKGF
jgi:hypothetical protein